jgi:hypothetical protein
MAFLCVSQQEEFKNTTKTFWKKYMTKTFCQAAAHTAIIQAGANFQWADYDMFPALQAHVLLGVGGSTTALREAGDGLLTKIVRAAARFVLRASSERLNAV